MDRQKVLILCFAFSPAYAEKISYDIYEIGTGYLVQNGMIEYSQSDVILNPYERNGQKIVEKYVELDKGFKIGARIFQDDNELTGFGLVAKLTDVDFSWEWYDKESANVFVKRQGGTKVRVKTSGLPFIEILEEVEFLNDTVLSFSLGGAGKDESHDITVKKGSVLKFN